MSSFASTRVRLPSIPHAFIWVTIWLLPNLAYHALCARFDTDPSSMRSNTNIQYWACPVNADDEYLIYSTPVPDQTGCIGVAIAEDDLDAVSYYYKDDGTTFYRAWVEPKTTTAM